VDPADLIFDSGTTGAASSGLEAGDPKNSETSNGGAPQESPIKATNMHVDAE